MAVGPVAKTILGIVGLGTTAWLVSQAYIVYMLPQQEEEYLAGWHKHKLKPDFSLGPDPYFSQDVCAASPDALCAHSENVVENAAQGSSADQVSLGLEKLEGFTFDHMSGRRYSRGVSIVDIDGDGLDDLWFGDGTNRHSFQGGPVAMRNKGGGAFTEISNLVPPEVDTIGNWGALWFDYDNDGDSDVVLVMGGYEGAGASRPALLQNRLVETGSLSLVDVSKHLAGERVPAGTQASTPERKKGDRYIPGSKKEGKKSPADSHEQIWWGASGIDFNRDGFTDVLVINTNQLLGWEDRPDWVDEPAFLKNGLRRPWALFQNQQNGSFVDVTTEVLPWEDGPGGSPIVPFGELKNSVWLDANGDGWQDLFIAGSPSLFFLYDPSEGRFQKSGILWKGREGQIPEATAEVFSYALSFSVCVADFNQDGFDDLYLGYWRRHDLVLLGGADGQLAAGMIVEKDLRGAPPHRKGSDGMVETSSWNILHTWENTMTAGVADLNHDGFPEAFIGTGTPDWGTYDITMCNFGNSSKGWQGLGRCTEDKVRGDFLQRGNGESRTHGFARGDVNGDGTTDLIAVRGGFALRDRGSKSMFIDNIKRCGDVCKKAMKNHCMGKPAKNVTLDTKSAESSPEGKVLWTASHWNCTWPVCQIKDIVCDTRDNPVSYAAPQAKVDALRSRTAFVRVKGLGGAKGSAIDAFGTRFTVTAGGGSWRRHATVISAHGFNCQDSAWTPLSLGPHASARLEIAWPSGRVSVEEIKGVERRVITEPAASA